METGLLIIFLVLAAIAAIFFIHRHMSEANIRKNGTKTQGTIVRRDEERSTDQYGRTHVYYYLVYEFLDGTGRRLTDRRRVSADMAQREQGDPITVYYLPSRPERNVID